MTAAAAILSLVPLAQAAAIAGDNIKFLEKKDKNAIDFVGQGTKNIVGLELTKLTANEIAGFK